MDSGANAYAIDVSHIDGMKTSSLEDMNGSLTGFGPKPVSAKFQIIDKWSVGNLSCPPMKTIFIYLDHLYKSHKGNRMDGILGYEFLSNFRVANNFRKKEIYLWDRKSVEEQWALANLTEKK